MVAPNSAYFIEHRLGRMRVKNHKTQREIRGHKRPRERPERKRGEQKLRSSRRFGHGHPSGPSLMRPDQWYDGLHGCYEKCKDEGEVSEFCNHGAVIRDTTARSNPFALSHCSHCRASTQNCGVASQPGAFLVKNGNLAPDFAANLPGQDSNQPPMSPPRGAHPCRYRPHRRSLRRALESLGYCAPPWAQWPLFPR